MIEAVASVTDRFEPLLVTHVAARGIARRVGVTRPRRVELFWVPVAADGTTKDETLPDVLRSMPALGPLADKRATAALPSTGVRLPGSHGLHVPLYVIGDDHACAVIDGCRGNVVRITLGDTGNWFPLATLVVALICAFQTIRGIAAVFLLLVGALASLVNQQAIAGAVCAATVISLAWVGLRGRRVLESGVIARAARHIGEAARPRSPAVISLLSTMLVLLVGGNLLNIAIMVGLHALERTTGSWAVTTLSILPCFWVAVALHRERDRISADVVAEQGVDVVALEWVNAVVGFLIFGTMAAIVMDAVIGFRNTLHLSRWLPDPGLVTAAVLQLVAIGIVVTTAERGAHSRIVVLSMLLGLAMKLQFGDAGAGIFTAVGISVGVLAARESLRTSLELGLRVGFGGAAGRIGGTLVGGIIGGPALAIFCEPLFEQVGTLVGARIWEKPEVQQ